MKAKHLICGLCELLAISWHQIWTTNVLFKMDESFCFFAMLMMIPFSQPTLSMSSLSASDSLCFLSKPFVTK